jgi:hypothetical protein
MGDGWDKWIEENKHQFTDIEYDDWLGKPIPIPESTVTVEDLFKRLRQSERKKRKKL